MLFDFTPPTYTFLVLHHQLTYAFLILHHQLTYAFLVLHHQLTHAFFLSQSIYNLKMPRACFYLTLKRSNWQNTARFLRESVHILVCSVLATRILRIIVKSHPFVGNPV